MTTITATLDTVSCAMDAGPARGVVVRASPPALAWYALFVALIGVVALASSVRGIPFGLLSRDPNDLAGAPFYAGALSNAGVLMWWAAACTALLGALVLRQTPDRRGFPLLLGAGLLSGVLALDDMYMFHELAAPLYLGIHELAILGAYAACAGWWAWHNRALLRSWQPHVLLAALGCLGVSLVVDEAVPWWPTVLVWEDGAKLAGIGGWCGWICGFSYRCLAARLASAESDPPAASPHSPVSHAIRYIRPR